MDINCGKAPLVKYLDDRFIYIGNDRHRPSIEYVCAAYPNGTWILSDDRDIWPTVHIDYLICMGYTLGPDPESATVDKTVVSIAESHRPSSIILDCWAGFPPEHTPEAIIPRLIKMGYGVTYSWRLDAVNPTTRYASRKIWVLEW